MKFRYLIVYLGEPKIGGITYGNCELNMNRPLSRIFNDVVAKLQSDYEMERLVILNYKFIGITFKS